ncbi:FAD-dependent oxidoreductase [Phototrophicus methaneseepsis]|uniref:FAD-dependent oxidoreductase n=1 Tax=Phototrophicus methaneseepsis TaxID=2710758 RepID=A0A7S8EDJ0_9CHLR|nr:FAD-dependent oxidoreductase [Phototrophicus methaneseepsis]QPC84977.1 FAD-dependent oxidoreductase [Phototrophicus methaneseepsis]
MKQNIRIALADPQPLSRAGLRTWLQTESDIDIVYETDRSFSLIEAVDKKRIDVVVIKLPSSVMSIYYPIAHICRHNPHTRVLVYGDQTNGDTILHISKAGASGLIPSDTSQQDFVTAIRRAAAGEAVFSMEALSVILSARQSPDTLKADPLEELSDREYEVLIRTALGQSRGEISTHFSISPRTVDTYRQRIGEKLNLEHRADIIRYAIQRGLVDPTPEEKAPEHNAHIAWDEEFDMVVVGSGIGMVAALKAADLGMRVLVLEKQSTVGGTTAFSGGGLWVPNNYCMKEAGIQDSTEDALTYLNIITSGGINHELAYAFVNHCHEVIDLFREIGIDWTFMPNFQDYYPEFAGGVDYGRGISPTRNGTVLHGRFLLSTIYEAALARGAQVWLNSPAKRLIEHNGIVTGVVAEVDGIPTNIKARGGVVLASGGFDHNKAMVESFLRGPLYYSSAAEGNTGDGQIMGMAVGAGLGHMNERWGWPVYFDRETKSAYPALAPELGKPGALVVNRTGHRIMNEAGPYDLVTRAFYAFDSGRFEYSNIPAFVITDADHYRRTNQTRAKEGQKPSTWFVCADTLEELANMLNINPCNLVETVEVFNEYARTGHDPDFRRGESAFDRQTGGDPTRDDLINPCLGPLIEPPFYGASIWPGALGTSGGLQINANGQVLDVWGKPLGGLYAAGNTAASPFAGSYPGGGGTLSVGMTFAYIAARHLNQALTTADEVR